ncbi:hypothetical protein BDW02DRAFT_573093, partial [Decorospora gaudefroyi]
MPSSVTISLSIGDTLGFLITGAKCHQSFRTRTFITGPLPCSSEKRGRAILCDLAGANRML